MSTGKNPPTPKQSDADNAAWGLVIETERGQRHHSKYGIGTMTGISARKIAQMVARYRAMHRAGIQPSGEWWHDRVNVVLPADAATSAPTHNNSTTATSHGI